MKNIYLISIVMVLFSCNTMNKSTEELKPKSDLYSVLLASNYQGREEEISIVIDNQKELNVLFQSVGSTDIPIVDFTKSQVVALFLGTKNSGGFSISIDRIEENSGKIDVYKKVSSPKEVSMVTMALTNPFVIAEIRSKKEIIFK